MLSLQELDMLIDIKRFQGNQDVRITRQEQSLFCQCCQDYSTPGIVVKNMNLPPSEKQEYCLEMIATANSPRAYLTIRNNRGESLTSPKYNYLPRCSPTEWKAVINGNGPEQHYQFSLRILVKEVTEPLNLYAGVDLPERHKRVINYGSKNCASWPEYQNCTRRYEKIVNI